MGRDGPAALRKRRELLQLRLRRQDESRQFRPLAMQLYAKGLRRFSRLPPSRARELIAPFAHLPAQDERFHWPDIPGHACARWDTDSERSDCFRAALRACFPASARLALILHTSESGLVVGAQDAIDHADTLLAGLHAEVWVVSKRGPGGLVELSFIDQECCWLSPQRT